MAKPILIGIAGASCSGKTTVAVGLAEVLGPNVEAIGLDSYYHDLAHLADSDLQAYNLDEPAALEEALLIEQLRALAAGNAIDKPIYDYKTHGRLAETARIEPGEHVIVEGLFTLHWAEVRELFGLAVFVDIPHDIALQRRVARDRSHRGRLPESVVERYEAMVRPMAARHVIPTRAHADLVVDGTLSTDMIVKEILTALSAKRKDR